VFAAAHQQQAGLVGTVGEACICTFRNVEFIYNVHDYTVMYIEPHAVSQFELCNGAILPVLCDDTHGMIMP
jgi:hypothetical protein